MKRIFKIKHEIGQEVKEASLMEPFLQDGTQTMHTQIITRNKYQ